MSGVRREDYIQRQIRVVAAMIARMAGLRRQGAVDEARAELERAYAALLGTRADVIRRVDAKTATALLGSPEAIAAFARLLREEAAQESDEGRRQLLLDRAAELEVR